MRKGALILVLSGLLLPIHAHSAPTTEETDARVSEAYKIGYRQGIRRCDSTVAVPSQPRTLLQLELRAEAIGYNDGMDACRSVGRPIQIGDFSRLRILPPIPVGGNVEGSEIDPLLHAKLGLDPSQSIVIPETWTVVETSAGQFVLGEKQPNGIFRPLLKNPTLENLYLPDHERPKWLDQEEMFDFVNDLDVNQDGLSGIPVVPSTRRGGLGQ